MTSHIVKSFLVLTGNRVVPGSPSSGNDGFLKEFHVNASNSYSDISV